MSGVVNMVEILKELAGQQSYQEKKMKKTEDSKKLKSDYHLLLVSLFEFFFGVSKQLPDVLKVILE